MPTVVNVEDLPIARGFQLVVLEDGDRTWLRLSEAAPGKRVRFWATRIGCVRPIPTSEVVQLLRQRLLDAGSEEIDIDQALQFWPEGWDYWGGGQPQPIAKYLIWGEFADQVSQFTERQTPLRS